MYTGAMNDYDCKNSPRPRTFCFCVLILGYFLDMAVYPMGVLT